MSNDILALVKEIYTEGFCVLKNHFSHNDIEACRSAFEPILDSNMDIIKNSPNRGINRHYIPLPLEPPFYNPSFFDDDTIIAILEKILGHDFFFTQYGTDTPFKGSKYQDVHADIRPLFHEEPEHLHPPPFIVINFPFIDVTLDHGPFEVAASTQLFPLSEGLKRVEDKEIPLVPLLLSAGDVLIRNVSCLHRGTPNLSDEPRPVAVIIANRSWFWRGEDMLRESPISPETWDSLSKREQSALRYFYKEQQGGSKSGGSHNRIADRDVAGE